MNPQLLFWVPAGLRLSIILVFAGVVGYFFGWSIGLAVALVLMIALIVVQLNYLYLLSAWLDHPDSEKLPDGWGAWTDIFSRLYRMRRDDERNRAEPVSYTHLRAHET